MKEFKSLLVLTLLLGDFGTTPTSAKELYAAYTTPILARHTRNSDNGVRVYVLRTLAI